MRILFAGSPEIAVPSLRKIAGTYPCAVLTGADRRAGRGRTASASPVKTAALELGLPVIEADRIDAAVREKAAGFHADILAVAAFGRIFRQSFLDLFPLGGVNMHPSLLPRFRGPSPITAAILSGDAETGVTVQRIALKMDTGPILAQKAHPLTFTETTGSLSAALGELGSCMLLEALAQIADGTARETPQNDADATYCSLVEKEQGRIDWNEEAVVIQRKVRAFDPWPRAFTQWNGRVLLVLKSGAYPDTLGADSGAVPADASPGTVVGIHPERGLLVRTGNGILGIERIQLQNKKAMDWRSFANGHPEAIGSRLGG